MQPLRQNFIFSVLTMVFVSVLAGCAEPPPTLQRFEFAELVMGVRAGIILYEEDRNRARAAARAAFDRLQALDAVMSDYHRHSELMRLCQRTGTGPVQVSEDLLRVLERAEQVSRRTGGAFDITVGPVVQLWREARRSGTLPEPAALDAARRLVGWRLVTLDADAGTVTLARNRMRLDLGGIGKGFAADEAVKLLASRGASRCLVDLGGDLALGEPPPGAAGWRIAIESLAREPTDEPPALLLHNCGVATSGDRFQFLEFDGVRYSHLVDPRTGRALTDRRTVTVIARDGATADALASAASVLEVGAALTLLEAEANASGCIRLETPAGARIEYSAGFPQPRPAGATR